MTQYNNEILDQFHNEHLKVHRDHLRALLSEEQSQKKLKEKLNRLKKSKKKKSKRLKKEKEKIKSKIKKRPVGTPRKNFDYETAMAIVRSEQIGSVTQYRRWYQMNNPTRMPKNPDRAYKKQWRGWNAFLGTTNKYIRRPGDKTTGKGKYRSFEAARAFVRTLNLHSIQEWRDYINSGRCPSDIPSRPDIVYSKGVRNEYWLSWKDWFGISPLLYKTPEEIIKNYLPVLYIAQKAMSPRNVYVINAIPGGDEALVPHLNKINARLFRAYYIDANFSYREFVSTLNPYEYSTGDEFFIPNIFDVIEHLDSLLSAVRV